jgi:hypothetical protein
MPWFSTKRNKVWCSRSLLGAVAGTLQHTEVGAPGTDGFEVLVGHNPGDLVEMSQVMSRPACQVLRQSHGSEGRMASATAKIRWLEVQGSELVQAFGARTRKFIQQLSEGLALTGLYMASAIEGLKRTRLARLQDHLRARDPIGALAINEVGDDIEGAPSAFAFVAERPGFRQIAEKGIESRGGAS